MELYNASISGQPNGVTGTHYGTLMAAIHRMETIFSQRETRLYNDGKFYTYGHQKAMNRVASADTLRRVETPEEHLRSFANFMNGATFYKTTLEFNKILPLKDCWDDDPVGSGGTKILEAASLGEKDREQATAIFHPFSGIIYPEDIENHLKLYDIRRMEKAVRNNPEFNDKLIKRRRMMGEEVYALDKNPEIVWQYMTMKFYQWAIQKGYDAFSYQNKEEGNGETSFIGLNKNSIQSVQAYAFDGEAFYNEVLPIYSKAVQAQFSHVANDQSGFSSAVLAEDIWEDLDIEKFMIPKPLAVDHTKRIFSSLDSLQEK